ncbi:MAG: pitrilysin family protein [Myxococcota bacterium]
MPSRTLPTGLRVVVDPSHSAKVAAVQVWVQVGSADERPEEAGLAHVHEHMLFKGTARRKVGEIAGDVEAAGGDINAYTSFDQTVYHVTLASREVDVALDILSDAVLHSAFDPEELERELEVVLEELRRGKDSPGRMVSEVLFRTAFEKHTYGRPIIGYVDTVERFSREDILAFYRRHYRPENMLLVVAGDVDPEAIFAKAEELFLRPEGSPQGAGERPLRELEAPQEGLRYAEERMDIGETHLSVAWPGAALSDADTPALDVLSVLLGTGESSRLYRRVRRDLELVTDAYAYAYTPKDPGLIGIGAQIQGRSLQAALSALLQETLRLRYEAPDEDEIQKAKTIVLSEAVYSMQTVQGRARRIGYFELVAGGMDFEAKYRAAVEAVTAEELRRVAQKWLDPHRLTVATVRPDKDEEKVDLEAVQSWVDEVVSSLEEQHRTPAVEALDLGVVRAQLSNGATVYVQPDAGEVVSIYAVGKGGLLDESAPRAGVSHLVGELLVRGTAKYSAEQISDACDAMAGGVGGQSGRNSLGLRGEFLRASWPQGFEYFASCLLEPRFDDTEVERERRTALEDIASRADAPATVAFDAFAAGLYGEHPYGRSVLGTEESLRSLDREAVLDAYRSQLRPDALTLAVVGGVDVGETLALLERRIGAARPHADARAFTLPSDPEPVSAPREARAHRDKAQTQLVLGYPGLTLDDPRRFALEMFTQVLGGQSGRLFLELRDRQSLAYSVGCFSLEGLAPGYVALHIGTHPDKLEVAEAGMLTQLDRMKTDLVDAKELARAKRYVMGSYEIGLQRASSRASSMVLNATYGIGYDSYARHAEQVGAVTAEEVRDIARELIRPERVVRSIVGPGAEELDAAS